MKVAFYKGSGRLFDILVRWWTSGQFSHCELILENGPRAYSASSSFRDRGVRVTFIDYTTHPERWELVDISHLPEEVKNKAATWFSDNKGKKYDVLGLFGFILRFYKGKGSRYFCSEAVAESLGFVDSWRFCPNTLYAALKSAGGNFASK